MNRLRIALLFLIFLNVACTIQMKSSSDDTPAPCGQIVNPDIREASGMVASRRNRDALWVLNDGGNGPFLYALSNRGDHLGKFRLSSAKNMDWEDLAHFRHDGTDYLLIADVGDNRAQREYCTLYIVVEPSLRDSDRTVTRTLQIAWQRDFRYEDGPRDCEAVAVDNESRSVLLLSKRDTPPVLYRLPLFSPETGGNGIAKKVTVVSNIPQPTPADLQFRYGRYRSQPTAMDLSPTGRTMAVLTYKHAYVYTRSSGEDWKTAINRPPEIVKLPAAEKTKLRQREALCFGREGLTLFVTSEDQFAPIYCVSGNGR